MFTQCPKCETVFRLSAQALRAAGGQVRCGRCGEVFNALSRLAEDANEFIAGESPLDLEARADAILRSDANGANADAPAAAYEGYGEAAGHSPDAHTDRRGEADTASAGDGDGDPYGEGHLDQDRGQDQDRSQDQDRDRDTESYVGLIADLPPDGTPPMGEAIDPPPGVEIAHLQVLNPLDQDPSAETSLEFTLPPGDLDLIFVETLPDPLQQLTAEGPRGERLGGAPASAPLAPAAQAEAPGQPTAAASGTAREAPPATHLAGLEVSDEVRREMLKSYTHAELPDIHVPRRRLPFAAWLAAAIGLGLLLAAQILYSNVDWVAAHAHLLGGGPAPAQLSSYQLRQWGVSGNPAAQGTLRVRASILNAAAQLQPYPLLRVTLANRFGTRVGVREFEPAEYLGKPPARMLAPGEQADAVLDILDPGKDAEGFEIDVCVRDALEKVHCAGDAAARRL